MKIKSLIYLIFFFFQAFLSFAQSSPIIFGQIDISNLKMKEYEHDTTAEAVILSDYGNTYFTNSSNNRYVIAHEKHVRIKILKKEGYKWADVEIPLYKNGYLTERIYKLKASTFNIENFEIKETKLGNKESKYKEEISDEVKLRKFTLPNVKVGSIIEYSYVIESPFIHFYKSWDFQTSIPVVRSEYNATIHPYFEYQYLTQGYHPFKVNERTPSGFYKWVMVDVPAIKEEKYITTLEDYISRIDFELIKYQYPGETPTVVMGTWKSLTKKLLLDIDFGKRFKISSSLKSKLKELNTRVDDEKTKFNNVFDFITDNIKWNKKNRIFATEGKTFKKIIEIGIGNSADLNLLLIAMLKESGIEADPIILSTRKHGKVSEKYPLLQKFNYVISRVKIAGNYFLIDATDPLVPFGMLPRRCINGKGKLISKSYENIWVSLDQKASFNKVISANISINGEELQGKVSSINKHYSAHNIRKIFSKEGVKGLEELASKMIGECEIENYEIEGLYDKNKFPKQKIEFSTTDHLNITDNAIYLNPLIGFELKENPFKKESRIYPVDFGAKYDETIIVSLSIPKGYEIETKPEKLNISLPKTAGYYRYNVAEIGNLIQISCSLRVAKSSFEPKEYKYLREFYTQIIAKQNEQIILRKIN